MDTTNLDVATTVEPIVVRDPRITSAESAAIMDAVRTDGFAVIKGLPPDPMAFQRFSSAFDIEFVCYDAAKLGRARLPDVDASIATVNDGWGPFGWHAEASGMPMSPQCLFFFCSHSPRVAGETLFADGSKVYEHLAEPFRQVAAETRLLYAATFDPRQPEQVSPHLAAFRADSIDELEGIWKSVTVRDDEDWAVSLGPEQASYQFSFPLVRTSAFSNRQVICGFFMGQVLDGEGRQLSMPLREAVVSTAYRCAYFHRWEDGDVVFVDNTRVMHARNAYNDPQRRILVRLGSYRQ